MSDHIVWVTKYRYHVLKGDIQLRCQELLIQICDSENVPILNGAAGKDHVHLHVEYPPSLSISVLYKKLKGRTFHHLQQEFPALQKRYLGHRFRAIGYGAWSTGSITEELVQDIIKMSPILREAIGF